MTSADKQLAKHAECLQVIAQAIRQLIRVMPSDWGKELHGHHNAMATIESDLKEIAERRGKA